MSSARGTRMPAWLAGKLTSHDRRLTAVETASELAYSSIENGAIDEYDRAGQLSGIIGRQYDGTHATASVAGPKPATPWLPTASAVPGIIEVRWNGKFAGDAVSPMDYKHTAAYVVAVGGLVDLGNQAGVMTGELGDSVQVQAEAGVHDVYLAAWTLSGKVSDLAGPVSVVVPELVDSDALQQAIDDAQAAVDAAELDLAAAKLELGGRLDTAESELSDHDDRLATDAGRIDTALSGDVDVDRLSIGTGVIADLVAQHIAGKTASFQTADIKNLFATTGTLSEAVINRLFVDVVKSRKITADMILVGSGGNLLTNPDFANDGEGWSMQTGRRIVPNGYQGLPALEISAVGSTNGSYLGFSLSDSAYRFRAPAGATIRVSGWVNSTEAITPRAAQIYLRFYDIEGNDWAWGSTQNISNEETLAPGEWHYIEGMIEALDRDTGGVIGYYKSSGHDGVARWSGVRAALAVDTSIIATGAIIAPHIRASEEMSAKLGEFLRVNTHMLEADAIDGMVITGAIFQSPGDGAGFQLTENGYTSRDADGNVTVRIPADGTTAQFRGDLEAKSLTASGRVSFQAPENEIASGAAMVLESGVQAPASPPTVGSTYPTIAKFPTPPERANVSGLAYAAGLWWRGVNVLGTGEGDRIEGITSAGEVAVTKAVTVDPRGGIAAIGDELFVLGKRHDRPNTERWVEVYGVTGGAATYKRRWEYAYFGSGTYEPGIGVDGASLLISQCLKTGEATWANYDKTTGAQSNHVTSDYKLSADVAGIYGGNADFGTKRFVVSKGTSTNATSTFTPGGAEIGYIGSWYAAKGKWIAGLVWRGGKFYHLYTTGELVAYSSLSSSDGDTNDWWLTQTFTGPGGKETEAGPAQRFTFMRRSVLRMSGGESPPGVTGSKFYLAALGNTPGRVSYHLIAASSGTSASDVELPSDWIIKAVPPASNTFANTDPGIMKSRIGGFVARGDGSGSWGPLTFNPDGTLSGVPVVKSGSLVITPSAANMPTPVTVTFPGSPFLTAPIVAVTAETSSPGRLVPGVAYMDSTTTSVTLYLTRTNTTPTGVSWIATGEGVLE